MNAIFSFGQHIDDYSVPVLNERAVRAGAGILFLFAIIAFMNAWLMGNFQPTRVFVIAFLIDFTVRIFINPKYAPSLVLGQWLVRRQQPEWTGAPQKRFAWAIGFTLASLMLWLVVIQQVVGPVNILVCAACLTLLFFEAAFGICLGCKVYNLFNKDAAQLCPGAVCDTEPDPRVQLRPSQGLSLVVFLAIAFGVTQWVYQRSTPVEMALRAQGGPGASQVPSPVQAQEAKAIDAERCKVPDFAKALGHEQMWKLHNNCQ